MATAARAHFLWVVPSAAGANLIFSDSLEPDSAELLLKIGHTECFTCSRDGKTAPAKFAQDNDVYKITDRVKESCLVGGVCRYGVLQKGGKEPFLLMYYAKALLGPVSPAQHKTPDMLALDVAPTKTTGTYEVRWQGKPLAKAEVVILTPGKAEASEATTDMQGQFKVPVTGKGVYGIRAKHIENRAGEVNGKKYQSVRHYATLTFVHDE
jgi:uncharacterized GH25 family protein